MRPGPREGWIIAGTLDGRPASPTLAEDVAGIPYLLRLAGELALAGVRHVVVVWTGPGPAPDVRSVAADPRLLSRATLVITTAPPDGPADEPIAMLRADRVWHRDAVKVAVGAWKKSEAPLAKVAGDDYDGIVVTTRARAAELATSLPTPGAYAAKLAELAPATAPPPERGFTMAMPDAASVRRAERNLVWSLRKTADGIAATHINRSISLPITWALRRTGVLPNHITILAWLSALIGAFVIARGTYVAGIVGMLLVELGSIVDGIDGELARLKLQFSRTGQWLDTVADDLGNVAYTIGVTVSLTKAGVTWAEPLAIVSLIAFALTQSTQYFLIARVYRSGDLAAIPWAFQSSEFLSQRPTGFVARVRANIPKLLKRDFAVTLFVLCAILGRLDIVLLVFSAGAIVFFFVFFTQLVRNWRAIKLAAQTV